jgi:hypothetical protein
MSDLTHPQTTCFLSVPYGLTDDEIAVVEGKERSISR